MSDVFTPQRNIDDRRALARRLISGSLSTPQTASSLSPIAALIQGLGGGFLRGRANTQQGGNADISNRAAMAARDAAINGGSIGQALLGSADPRQQAQGLTFIDRERDRAGRQDIANRRLAQTRAATKREIKKGADDRQRFVDTGELVFPNVSTPEQTVPEKMNFSKEAAGRFNAARARGATAQEAIAEATSTSSERTSNVKVDQAVTSLKRGLKRFEDTVLGTPDAQGRRRGGTGANVVPFTADRQKTDTQRRGIQLQLKELFNLGVLNGPDLALMNELLADPSFSLNPLGDSGVNIPVNLDARMKASISEVNSIIEDIVAGKRLPSQFGQRAGQPAAAQAAPAGAIPPPPPGFVVVE